MEKRQIILIGGAPTVGKTSIAKLLSKHLGIPWISTDMIREIMRGTVDNEDYPNLLKYNSYSAKEYLTNFSAEEIIKHQDAESEEVWVGVKALIDNSYPWKSFIIEGVAIVPHFVKQDFDKFENIKTIFLFDEDIDRIKNVIWNRGLCGAAKTYSDNLKPKELEWARTFGTILKREAEKYGFPCIEVQKDNSDLDLVIKALSK